jgi:hypothetical protein
MPWLAAFLGGILVQIISFFMKYVTRVVAVKLGYVALFTALLITFATFILALMNSAIMVLPATYGTLLSYLIPWNLYLCASIIATAHLAKWMFQFKDKLLRSIFPQFPGI